MTTYNLEQLYKDMLDLVAQSINIKIEKNRIETAIQALADIFGENLYNDMLLYCYGNSKNNYIYSHIANNTILAVGFATSLGLSRQDIVDAGLCAFGHDFGMVEFADIFQKSSQLTSQEKANIQQHTQKSADKFKDLFPPRVIDGILDMHEMVNGQGYPKGKTSQEIAFLAKIVSICDVYEALTHARSFREELSPYEAIKTIIKMNGVIFEKNVVRKFIEFMSIYPVGSMVRINTGEVGRVIGSNPQYPTRSVIRILFNVSHDPVVDVKIVDLLNDHLLYVSAALDVKQEKELMGKVASGRPYDIRP